MGTGLFLTILSGRIYNEGGGGKMDKSFVGEKRIDPV